jgi:hypothetical protein
LLFWRFISLWFVVLLRQNNNSKSTKGRNQPP